MSNIFRKESPRINKSLRAIILAGVIVALAVIGSALAHTNRPGTQQLPLEHSKHLISGNQQRVGKGIAKRGRSHTHNNENCHRNADRHTGMRSMHRHVGLNCRAVRMRPSFQRHQNDDDFCVKIGPIRYCDED